MRLRDIREDKDLTQQQLATQLHIRQNTYSQYENGQRGLPMDMLIRLSLNACSASSNSPSKAASKLAYTK